MAICTGYKKTGDLAVCTPCYFHRQPHNQPAPQVSFNTAFISCPLGKTKAVLLCAVFCFSYLSRMKALVITPKSDNEYKFLSNLLSKLGVGVSSLSKDELEDIGLAKMMHNIDKSKKAGRSEILKKLNS